MKKGARASLLAIVIVIGAATGLGILRYGGVRGVIRRAQAHVRVLRPHDLLVPTPLPTTMLAETAMSTSPTVVRVAPSDTPEPSSTEPSFALGLPTVSITPTRMPVPLTPTPSYKPSASAVALTGIRHAWQTWNNCAPATLAMYLSYYGETLDQHQIGDVLRPNKEDKHVSAAELARYARGQGYEVLVRYNGSAERLQLLLSNDVPVMIASWEEPSPGDGMGHYRLVTGYDDGTGEWILYDSLSHTVDDPSALYTGIRMSYETLDDLWSVYHRLHIIVYPEPLSPMVEAIMGRDLDPSFAAARGVDAARQALLDEPERAYNWFNLGTALVQVGAYQEASEAYDQARHLGLPWRMLWYQFGPFETYYHVGRYDEVVALADATLRTTQHVEELHYWKALALAEQGHFRDATRLLERALALRPDFPEAHEALDGLR